MELNNLYKKTQIIEGQNCSISPFATLENVVMGDNVTIRDGVQLKNVVIGSHTKIGRNVTFYSANEKKPVRIGSHCVIAYGVFGEATAGEMTIGDNTSIAHYAVMLTSSGPGENNPKMFGHYGETRKPVLIGPSCWIGAGAVILPGVNFPEGVALGANSVALGFVYDAWSSYNGSPAKFSGKIEKKD